MKVGPSAHYSVGVRPQDWDVPTDNAPLYRGIFAVELNHHADISFVPNISSVAPPWDSRQLPVDIDTVDTMEMARLAAALLSSYVVTPNDELADSEEQIGWHDSGTLEEPAFVFYVTADAFSRYVADLETLTEIASGLHVRPLVDDLRDREVIAFIERRIVASGLLRAYHAEMLGQAR